MKKIYLLITLIIPLLSFGQSMPTASKEFNIVTDLRAQAGTDNVQVSVKGLITVGDQNGGQYYWSASSTDADDGFITIKVTTVDTGRWKRLPNANTVKGNVTFSATLVTSSYVVNHGLPFTPLQIYVQPTSANAAVPSWVSNINATSFTVNFASVPILGTNNISIFWLAIKQ